MYYLTVKNLLYVRRSSHKAYCWATMAAVLALHTFWGSAQNAEFEKTCAVCHGGRGEGTDRAPALANNRELRGISEKRLQP